MTRPAVAPAGILKLGPLVICVFTILIALAARAQQTTARQPSLSILAPSVPPSHANRAPGRATRAASQGINNPVFLPGVSYTTGGATQQVAIADVNGDGKPDLIVTNFGGETQEGVPYDGSISVLLGNGDGTFQAAVNYDSGGVATQSVFIADLTGNGKLDVIVTNGCAPGTWGAYCSAEGLIGVLLGNGDGSFQAAQTYPSGGWNGPNGNDAGSYAVVADINRDGKPDIIVANSCASTECANGGVSILLGNGDGTFQPALNYSSGAYGASGVAVGDMNGDGKPDLVVANYCAMTCSFPPSEGAVTVLLGNGDGTFQTPVSYDSGEVGTVSVAVADLNGGGKLDIVAASIADGGGGSNLGGVGVLLGNGNGTFQPVVTYGAGYYPLSVALADVTMDGNLDIVVGDWQSGPGGYLEAGAFSVLPGNGDGTFQSATVFFSGQTGVSGSAVADVDGDGKPDVVTANVTLLGSGYPGSVYVFLNNAGTPSVTTTSVSSSLNPSVFGQQVTFTATVTSNSVTPAGTVNFYDGSTLIGSATINSGSAQFIDYILAAGSHSITAAYQGSVSLQPSTSSPVIQVVSTTTSLTSLSSSSNPVARNQAVTFTAFVTSRYGGPVTGSVVFTSGSQTLGTGPLYGPYASLTTSFSVDGSYSIIATYSGDANNAGSSTSPPWTQYVDSIKTTTKVTTSGSPSLVGQPVTFAATIKSKQGAIPDGETVTFNDNRVGVIGTGTTANGVATITTSSLPAGKQEIKATYPGDATYLQSFRIVKQTVDLYSTVTALTSNPNPSNQHQAVTFTATVTSAGPDTPTGEVVFKDGGTYIGKSKLSGGVAALTKPNLAVGTHSITAQYNGDEKSAKSTSPVLTQVVN